MTMRRGRCNNIGLCENATRQRTIEVADAAPFVCPKCGSELVSVADRKSTRSAASVALPVVVIALAVAGVGYKVWDMYGRAGPATATQAMAPSAAMMAPAKPRADAAMAPAASPAPAAAAPAPEPAPVTPQTATAAPPTPVPAAAAPSPSVAPAPAVLPQPAPAVQPPAASPPLPAAPATPATEPAPTAPEATKAAPANAAAADPAQRVQAFLGNAARVPIVFTFRSSVVALTGRSEHDLDRLVSYLKAHHATGDRVYLAGFTDNQGDPASNEAVSQKRVAAVAAALTQAGIAPAHVASFGAAMPVADNATQAGRDRNRRVEVYLAP